MRGAQMPAQGSPVEPAFEAHDVFGLHRSPDWHRRRQPVRCGRRRWRVRAETAESAMHARNQAPDLIDTNRVFPDVTADDLGDQAGINFLCTAVVGQSSSPRLI